MLALRCNAAPSEGVGLGGSLPRFLRPGDYAGRLTQRPADSRVESAVGQKSMHQRADRRQGGDLLGERSPSSAR